MDRVFTIEQLRPIKNSMTISRDAKMGTTTVIITVIHIIRKTMWSDSFVTNISTSIA